MKELTFEDLLRQPCQRVMKTEIKGLGVVSLTELSGADSELMKSEAALITAKSKTLDEKRDAGAASDEIAVLAEEVDAMDSALVVRWVARFLSGDFVAADAEQKIKDNLSPAVRKEIYFRGLQFNVLRDEFREHVEKNS